MLTEMSVSELTLNELSRRVGLAKSNVLRYFESREQILLELLDREAREWTAELAREVAATVDPAASPRVRGEAFASAVGRTASRHPALCDLVGAQSGVLEHNVSAEAVRRHKRNAFDALAELVDVLAVAVPELGDAAWRLCLTAVVLAGALYPHSAPSASALAAYAVEPELAAFRLDLAEALESTVATLIIGTLARDGG